VPDPRTATKSEIHHFWKQGRGLDAEKRNPRRIEYLPPLVHALLAILLTQIEWKTDSKQALAEPR